jgi:site-specific DNA-methyltransferase (adenine-specific)
MQSGNFANGGSVGEIDVTAPATDAARQWEGWGTALKPAVEPIVLARKPLEGTVAENVQKYGTGALNIDGCRIPMGDEYDPTKMQHCQTEQPGHTVTLNNPGFSTPTYKPGGRWPANVMLSHLSECEQIGTREEPGDTIPGIVAVWNCAPGCPVALLNEQSGTIKNGTGTGGQRTYTNECGQFAGVHGVPSKPTEHTIYNDTGGAARFFYCAKVNKHERGEANRHPTVKPIALMEYLIRLVTPPKGLVLDPFAGSGSTLLAADRLGFASIGIEKEPHYYDLILSRVTGAAYEP